MDVRTETGIETYVNDEPDDENPGIIVDARSIRNRALTSDEARALAAELVGRASYFDQVNGAPRTHMVDTYGDLAPTELYPQTCTPDEAGVCDVCGQS